MKWVERLPEDECAYCGSNRQLEYDHYRPRSRGGVTTIRACRGCNRSKSDKTLEEWLKYLATSPERRHQRRWQRILAHQYRKKNPIARRVHKIRDNLDNI